MRVAEGKTKTLPLTTRNFKRICVLNRLTPSDCIRMTGKHRDTIYKALRNPRHFKPTIRLLEDLLPNREVNYAARKPVTD